MRKKNTSPRQLLPPLPDVPSGRGAEADGTALPCLVTLLADHTHAGRFYRAGQELLVDDAASLGFLLTRQLIAPLPSLTEA
jgi:hypothetical protein